MDVIQKYDSLTDGIKLIINVNKRKRVKIQKIVITGNEYKKPVDETEQFHGVKQFWRNIKNTEGVQFTDKSIKKKLKHTKEKTFWRFWKRSKFVEPDFKEDKEKVLAMYNKNGFRDAKIMNYHYDTVNSKRIKLSMEIYEGRPYYFGDITFVGNTKYSSEQLGRILDIEKGDVYNEEKLSQNIQFNQQNGDIFSLYYDDGYLTFQAIPVEISNDNDTINLEIRIQEGKQAKFKRVGVKGNTRTNDYVIVRELRAYPGQLFSRSDLISSMNELRMLRYFNDQTINPDVKPNFDDATADVTFQVEEVGSDQLELSGGWGAGQVVGTLGLTFNNFSIQNIFKRDRWKPLPSGDGQQFSIRAQSSGTRYWTISTSFTEPWLGGRKPLSLSVSYYHTQESTGLYKKSDSRFSGMTINGFVVGLGQRLRWPDNYFTLYQSVGYQKYDLNKYNYFRFPTGNFNNLSYTVSLTRQSLDAAIFPKNGSEFGLSLQLTPPYSLMNNKDYGAMEEAERYKWLEYYKWTFKAGMYMNPVANLVLNARMRLGLLNYYDHSNSALDYPPMERFYVGGDGLSGFSLGGRDLIGLRGYPNNSLSADDGSCAFSKFTFEMRYPLTTNPMATIYVLSFVEAGAAWDKPSDINPFNLYKSAGFGVRLFMAAMGMFGLDWGYGFDRLPGATSISGGRMHFSINQSLDW